MNIKPEIGKIYDTLFFCIELFNEDEIKETVKKGFTDTSFMDECYYEIKEKTFALPHILEPIFLYRNQVPTAITDFFWEYIDFENDNIDTFLMKIVSKSGVLYSKIVDIIFPNTQNSDGGIVSPLMAPESYIGALAASDYPDSLKLQISLMFGNYNYAVSLLVEQLRLIYKQVDLLHQKYAGKLDVEIEQIQSERNVQLYEQLFSVNILDPNEHAIISMSLLNQYLTQFVSKNNNWGILLGFNHEEDLNRCFDEQNINLRELLVAIGNDIRISVIQTLMKEDELTVSSISKIIDIPLTTVLRHIEILYNSGALYISRRSGLQIFYRINYNLLNRATNLASYKLNKQGGETNDTIKEANQMG